MNIFDESRPPWETSPHGVVSLLAMLEFAARDFVDASYMFGLFLSGRERITAAIEQNVPGDALAMLAKNCSRLGLNVTQEHVVRMIEDVIRQSPKSVGFYPKEEGGGFYIKDGKLDPVRSLHHIETIHSTMRTELGAMLFCAIPRERTIYCVKWLSDTPIRDKFPTSLKELERAGQCYALGESTACVFHSMRALEPALNSLAQHFKVSFQQENWQVVIEQVEAEIRKLGSQPKSPQKMEDEKFFGGAAAQLYFVKNAWRNHVAHTRETYSDKEALPIMQHSLQFIESLCPRLGEPI